MAAVELYSLPIISDANLLAYYRMEGNGNDYKSSNNLTNSGGTFSAANGKFGQGVGFTGAATSWLYDSSFPLPATTSSKSISCWFSPSDQPATNGTYGIIGYHGEESLRQFDFRYVDVSGTKKLKFQYGNSTNQYILVDYTCATGSWYYLAATYGSGIVTFYANSVPIGTKSSINLDTQTNSKLVVGGIAQSDIYGLWGKVKVDDFAIFNDVLTSSEISEIYDYQSGSFFHMST